MKIKILIIITLITLLILPNQIAFSVETPLVKANNCSGALGEQVSMDITISENSNVCVGELRIIYDNTKLELVSCEAGDVIKNAMPQFNGNYKPNEIKAVFMTTMPIVKEGVLCQLNFKIISKEGTAQVRVSDIDFYKFDESRINVQFEDGTVEIKPNVSTENTTHNNGSDKPTTSNHQQMTQTPTPQQAVMNFTDLEEYLWALTEIEYLAGKGIIKGTSPTTFEPSLFITRADYMVLLVRMLGLEEEVTENFTDVKADMYYYREIGIAKKMALTNGVGNNMFNPSAPITRQDMFCIAYRILKSKISDDEDLSILNEFKDTTQIADYAKQPIAQLIKNNFVRGNDSLINPLLNATRAETSVFIYRLEVFLSPYMASLF